MNKPVSHFASDRLNWKIALLLSLAAGATFNLAYTFIAGGFLIFIYLACLVELTRLSSTRQGFYFGMLAGLLACAPQAGFFYAIFGPAAIALWAILAFWIALFVATARAARVRFGFPTLLLIPFLWTGFEYFRSELYYLRFTWLNVGYSFAGNHAWVPFKSLGMYGLGFCLLTILSVIAGLRVKQRFIAIIVITIALALITILPSAKPISLTSTQTNDLQIAGVQLEFPSEQQVLKNLDEVHRQYPSAQLLVLSEYTFTGPIPVSVKDWCRSNHQYLLIGGEEPVSTNEYYDTAFVIDPAGNIIFQQAKSVPIQFFKDGLPAREQKLWDSPWGKIGVCICYDLSYTRVTDQLIRLGAQALIVPSMDIAEWGAHQHQLHARVAPTRAAEYGVPIFRIASSGISQCVDASGRVLATAPMPGESAIISGTLHFAQAGALPLDRYLAPIASIITGLTLAALTFLAFTNRRSRLKSTQS